MNKNNFLYKLGYDSSENNRYNENDEEFFRPSGFQENRFTRLHRRLLALKENSSNRGSCIGDNNLLIEIGICGNVDVWSFLTDEEILDMWESWEYYSGNTDWPIRNTNFCERNHWEGKTKQSQQRYLLLDHCIKHTRILAGFENTI